MRADRAALAYEQRRSLHRALVAIALAGRERTSADRLAKAHWPDDRDAERITRAATSPTDTGDYPALNSSFVMPLAAPSAAATKLFARATSVDLAGLTSVSLVHPDVVPLPAFIGEAQPAPVAQLHFDGTPLGPVRKMLLLTGLSGELESASPQAASVIIGRALNQSASLSLDAAAFASTAGDAVKPPGLLYGATPITATTGGGAAAMVTDLGALAGALAAAGFGDEMVLVMNAAQVVRLRLLASPTFTNVLLGTTAVPDKTIIGIAPSGIGVAYDGTATVEMGRDALVHWDTAPAPIVDGGVMATPTRSGFQQDIRSLRLRAWAAWVAIPGSVQFISGTTW